MHSVSAVMMTLVSLGGSPNGEVLNFSATWCGPCRSVAPTVARLERQGYPIRKVDIDKHPELARKYGVSSVPQFILVVDGEMQQRVVGPQSEQTLKRLIARIPDKPEPREQETAVAARDESGARLGIPIPFLGKKEEAAPPEVIRGQNDHPADDTPPAYTREPLDASVRLRVRMNSAVHYGSGTIVDSNASRSLIVSCGHIFRGADENTRIEVDVFENEKPKTYIARLIRYNDQVDFGLISIAPGKPLPAAHVASDFGTPQVDDLVFSVGCGGGDDPTKWQMMVKSLQRFYTECTQAPDQGRSGGGLFNRAGELIGICMAQDAKRNTGLYVSLDQIHAQLDKLSLTQLYAAPESQSVAASEREAAPFPRGALGSVSDEIGQDQAPPAAPARPAQPQSRQIALTDGEVDAIAAALENVGRHGVSVRIQNAAGSEAGYSITIVNRMARATQDVADRRTPAAAPTEAPAFSDDLDWANQLTTSVQKPAPEDDARTPVETIGYTEPDSRAFPTRFRRSVR